MSKVSAMQAMREARYTTRTSVKVPVPTTPGDAAAPAVRTASGRSASVQEADLFAGMSPVTRWPVESATAAEPETPRLTNPVEPSEAEVLCGHRSMNNRNCRRPAGHPEKNHRYS